MKLVKFISWLSLATVGFSAIAVETGRSDLNLRKGVSDISHQVYDLHMLMFYICVVIAVVVFGVMFYSMFAQNR